MPEICFQKAPGQFSIEISSVLGYENFRFMKIYLVLGNRILKFECMLSIGGIIF